VTATTLGAQQTMLAGLWRCGGDAQERAATNPVAALPCARTPLLQPLFSPLLIPLLIPPSATVGADAPDFLLFGLVEVPDPGQGPGKKKARGGRGALDQGGPLARSWLVGPPPTPWGASRRAAVAIAGPSTTNGGRMASRRRPRWGTGPAPTHRDVETLA
jgi:hypothetical protein